MTTRVYWLGLWMLSIAVLLSSCNLQALTQPTPASSVQETNALPSCNSPVAPPLKVIHFFDWYANDVINGPRWTHQVNWGKYGLRDEEVGSSKAYYDSQFALINDLGVDGLVYQFYKEADGSFGTKLSPNFLASLQEHKTKIGLFYDWEIQQVGALGPVLSEQGYIKPTTTTAQRLVDDMVKFYHRIPRELWLTDQHGQLPIMVFAFGFDQTNTDAQAWYTFYATVLQQLETRLSIAPVIYWTARNLLQLEYAYQHFPEQIKPFNFVLDNPQPQLAPGAVTWNVNFDNLGVQRHHHMQRVIRDDPRYIQEMLWLAKYTAPDLLFIYSWNEYYEGANIMPDQTYGTSRYKLMQALLKDVQHNSTAKLPCTLLVVDDYSKWWTTKDWHLQIEREFTLYPLRRLAPQADVQLATKVTPELMQRYDLIIVLAQRTPDVIAQTEPLFDRKRVVIIGPQAAQIEPLRTRFATQIERAVRNTEVHLVGGNGTDQGSIFVRDDVFNLVPAPNVATSGHIVDGTSTPVLLRNGDDWWINAFVPDDRILAPVFEHVYGRPLEQGIMYGEGLRSQRLEIAPDGTVTQNTFSAPAVYEHEPLPVSWSPPPPPLVP